MPREKDGGASPSRRFQRARSMLVGDAATLLGAPLVELLLPCGRGDAARLESVAFAAPALDRESRAQLARRLAGPRPLPPERTRDRGGYRGRPCDAGLARLLGRTGCRELLLPIGSGRSPPAWLRIVLEGRPDRTVTRSFRPVMRQVAARLELEGLRRELESRGRLAARDVDQERRALAELSQAKDTLGALSLAGTHLMVETDGEAICRVICRDLIRLGFHSAVLVAEPATRARRPSFRWMSSSFELREQRATERILGRRLEDVRVDPRRAPLVARVLRQGRTIFTARAREVARQLFDATRDQLPRLARLLALRHVVVAPLRYRHGISGLLVVGAVRLRRSDPEGIDAFALQASIALEKARLFAELKRQQARLESEVARRTAELTEAVAALREADRRKDNFLANVSHELRTPLVTVLGYTDLLLSEKMGELSARQRDCLRVTASSARRLRGFIDELLEFSRHELTQEAYSPAPVDPRELVSVAAREVAPRFQERGITLRTRVAPGTPVVWGDRERLLQVLANLLFNAERHGRHEGTVRLSAAGAPGGRVVLVVSDDGPGIARRHLTHIFDRLYQVGDVAGERGEGAGLGLGLAIVRSIVEAHGGRITVRSRLGRGTSFRVSLPAAGDAGREAASRA